MSSSAACFKCIEYRLELKCVRLMCLFWAFSMVSSGCGNALETDNTSELVAKSSRDPGKVADQPAPKPVSTSRFQRYVFRHFGEQETDFGELLVEPATGRCVYRFWFDGVVDKCDQINDRRAVNRHRSVFKTAAGFDGSTIWIAGFPSREANGRNAGIVRRFTSWKRAMEDTREGDHLASSPQLLSMHWYDSAPIHRIMTILKCEKWQGAELRRAVLNSPLKTQPGELEYDNEVNSSKSDKLIFSFTIRFGNDREYFDRIRISGFPHMGHWPYPMPGVYTAEHDRSARIIESEFDKLVNYRSYSNNETRFEDQ